MTIHKVSECGKLFRVLDECKGAVTLETADGRSCEWGRDGERLSFMATAFGTGTCTSLKVFCEDSKDVLSIIEYLAGCERAS